MAETKSANTIVRALVNDLASRHGEPTWLTESRLAVWESYLKTPMPTTRDEEWRRTDISEVDPSALTTADFGPVGSGKPSFPAWFEPVARSNASPAGLFFQATDSAGYLQIDPEISRKGVIFCDIKTAVEKHEDKIRPYLDTRANLPTDGKFGLLNRALFNCGAFLYVPAGLNLEAPFVSGVGFGRSTRGENGSAIFPRLIVVAEAGASLKILHAVGSDRTGRQAVSLCSSLTEIYVGANARVSFLEIQAFGDDVLSIAKTHNEIQRDGSFRSLAAALGGKQTKADIATLLQEPGAQSDVLGLVLGGGHEHYNFNTIQDHNATDTTSNINFRVALKDASTSVYQGIIKVAKVAQRTNAYQSNKNLLLGAAARADSVPKLEILADDVKCSHGATVGPVDREQVFYLMSRGLTLPQAEELIVVGFFKQVLEEFAESYPTDWLAEQFSRKIHQLR